jgi:hypothetical protein
MIILNKSFRINLHLAPSVIPAPYQVRGKLQQESIPLSCSFPFPQRHAWIPVCTPAR